MPIDRSFSRTSTRLGALIAAIALGACSSGDKTVPADSSAAASAAAPSAGSATPTPMDSGAGMKMDDMAGMAMTGDPDRDFLRMMSDHHKGLIQIAHMTKERKDVGMATQDATKLDTKQDADLDHMMTMLEKEYKDAYAPKVMAEHQQMADALKAKSGKDYERAFYQDIVKHHQEALVMIDGYLPRAKNAMLKGMAQTMKADQAREIKEFEQKLAKLGA